MTRSAKDRRNAPGLIILRVVIVACLIVDAVIHFQLAGNYNKASPGGIGAGNLFRIEAVVALISALYLLIVGSRRSYAVAAVVALSAFIAVLLSRYVELPPIGPIPSMYEPIWFAQKTATAIAEGLGGILAIGGFAALSRSGSLSKTASSRKA